MIIDRIISIIAPHPCYGCGREGSLLCRSCAVKLPGSTKAVPDYVYGHLYGATPYKRYAKQLVYALKFTYSRQAARDMAYLMVIRLPAGYRPDVVGYIPTATSRVRARGYDQARLIARSVARELGVPCRPLLARIGQKRQVGSSRIERVQQVSEAFRSTGSGEYNHVLLVDDVLTTGSSIRAAAAVLRRHGARQIDAVVFAVAE